LCREDAEVSEAIDRVVGEVNGSVDALDEFLSQQYYRLAYWRTADQQLGYRRFFDVNTLIGLRVEREFVFDETHALIVKWLKQGLLDGVRVDHPDGLRDPKQYFERLRERAPEAWIVGEKILEPGEWLREDWPVEGTSGYDFLNMAMGVLVNRPRAEEAGRALHGVHGGRFRFSWGGARQEDCGGAGGAGQRCESADNAVRGYLREQSRPARFYAGGDSASDSRGGGLLLGVSDVRGAGAQRDW
jgi:maltooligosyltrehalose synthase